MSEAVSKCPICGKQTGGEQKFLICQDCYLSPTHLIAKAEGLLAIKPGHEAPQYTEITRRIQ